MQEYLNENTLFITLALLLKEEPDDLVLVLEGPDDRLLLQRHCAPELRLMEATGGKVQVRAAASLAFKRGVQRARFLIDSDYDVFAGLVGPELENVSGSEFHDLFTDLIAADISTLHRVIDVHTDSRRRANVDNGGAIIAPSAELCDDTFDLASYLAAVRIVDTRKGLNLDFKRFKFGDLPVRSFSAAKVAGLVWDRNGRPGGKDRTQFTNEVDNVYSQVSGISIRVIGDHDLFHALARILKKGGVAVSASTLQKSFILTVDLYLLKLTAWFDEILEWGRAMGLPEPFTERAPISR